MKPAEILLIAPDEELYHTAKSLQGAIGFEFDVVYAFMDEAVRYVEAQSKTQDIKVILSRGATLNELRCSRLQIPLIGIRITDLEVIQLLQRARRVAERIAVVGFLSPFTERARLLSGVLGFEVDTYIAANADEVKEKVRQAIANGNECIIGVEMPYHYALEFGAKALLLTTPKSVIVDALLEAEKVMAALKLQIHQAEQQKAILNTIQDGILSVDRDGAINYCNAAAESMIDVKRLNIADVFGSEIRPLIEAPQNSFGNVLEVGGERYLLNISPILVDGEHTGAIVSFSVLRRMQEIELKTRAKLAESGFTAKYRFEDILTVQKEMRQIIEKCRKYAPHDSTILIGGQSGTGKELFAQSIHNASLRKDGPFVAINCAALPENLLESELFGYVDGAFTGAKRSGKIGYFGLAHGGTLFLDEIGEITPAVQSRLLRVLEEKSIMRVGDDRLIPVDVRMVFASNKNLLRLVQEGKFRQDLYYRINVLSIQLPPLAARREDILLLAQHFLRGDFRKFGKPPAKLSDGAGRILEDYAWPGNIRELRNVMERIAINTHSNLVTRDDVLQCIDTEERPAPAVSTVRAREYEQIRRATEECGGDREAICRRLGISKTTLWRRRKEMEEHATE